MKLYTSRCTFSSRARRSTPVVEAHASATSYSELIAIYEAVSKFASTNRRWVERYVQIFPEKQNAGGSVHAPKSATAFWALVERELAAVR